MLDKAPRSRSRFLSATTKWTGGVERTKRSRATAYFTCFHFPNFYLDVTDNSLLLFLGLAPVSEPPVKPTWLAWIC